MRQAEEGTGGEKSGDGERRTRAIVFFLLIFQTKRKFIVLLSKISSRVVKKLEVLFPTVVIPGAMPISPAS